MKTKKTKKENKKFDLDKMNFAKLKNLHIIRGGDGNDPIDTNHGKDTGSSRACQQSE